MARSYYITCFASLAGIFAVAASAMSKLARSAADFVTEMIEMAFPRTPRPDFAFAVAAAPRVTGLHQSRAFWRRLAERSDPGHRRAPLSSAFAVSA